MQRIDSEDVSTTLPAPQPEGSTVGYFKDPDGVLGTLGTKITADWLNGIQEEIASVIAEGGLSLNKASQTQLKDAILQIIADNSTDPTEVVDLITANAIHGTVGTTNERIPVADGVGGQTVKASQVEINSGTMANLAGLHIGSTLATKNPSAALEVTSTTGGLLLPRLSTTERNAIASPSEGLSIQNTTTTSPEFYNGGSWRQPLMKSGGTMSGALDASGGITLNSNITKANAFGLVTSGGLVAGSLINVRRFTSGTSATYTPTAGTRMIWFELTGGGGSGGRVSATGALATGAGGSGATVWAVISASNLSGTYTIGAAGGVPGSPSSGSGGGSSTFVIDGLTWTAGGGSGGNANSGATQTFSAGGPGGTPILPTPNANVIFYHSASGLTGDMCNSFQDTGNAICFVNAKNGPHSPSVYGTSTDAGSSPVLIAVRALTSNGATGLPGMFPGGGGGGGAGIGTTASSTNGSSGQGGQLLIFEYA